MYRNIRERSSPGPSLICLIRFILSPSEAQHTFAPTLPRPAAPQPVSPALVSRQIDGEFAGNIKA